mmetsp:Transcript_33061/g.70933  ORF Transcript_33061/g.70933 Transcript_33061/m.70933 type:complete len:686 (-) Transcript_33061:41-2098(-)
MPSIACDNLEDALRSEDWPLLGSVVASKGLSKDSFVHTCREIWYAWWSTTTSSPYLESELSRRCSRRLMVPILAAWIVVADLLFEVPSRWFGAFACLLLVAVAILPHSRLRYDFPAAGAALLHSIGWLVSYTSEEERECAHVFFMMISYWVVSLSIFLGVHPVMLLGYVVLLCCAVVKFLGFLASFAGLLYGCGVVAGIALLEGRIGQLMSECFKQEACIRNLLDSFSDGFVKVDSQTGSIEFASCKLSEVFDETLEGLKFADLLSEARDKFQLEEMLRSLDQGSSETFAPRLISLKGKSESSSLAAMAVPFCSTRYKLDLGLRLLDPSPKKTSAAGGAAVGAGAGTGAGAAGINPISSHGDIWSSGGVAASTVLETPILTSCPEEVEDVCVALDWSDDAVRKVLLGPGRLGNGKPLMKTEGVQTDPVLGATVGPGNAAGGAANCGNFTALGGVIGSTTAGTTMGATSSLQSPQLPKPDPGLPPPAPRQPGSSENFLNGKPNLPPNDGRFQRGSRSQSSRRSRQKSIASMSSGGASRTHSESSFGSSAGAAGIPNRAAGFTDTDLTTRRKSIIIMMHHWNLPRNPDACCPWHTAVHAVQEVAQYEDRTACKPLWSPFLGWQCASCTCLNHAEVHPCNVCGSERPPGVGEQAHGGDAQLPGQPSPKVEGPPPAPVPGALPVAPKRP